MFIKIFPHTTKKIRTNQKILQHQKKHNETIHEIGTKIDEFLSCIRVNQLGVKKEFTHFHESAKDIRSIVGKSGGCRINRIRWSRSSESLVFYFSFSFLLFLAGSSRGRNKKRNKFYIVVSSRLFINPMRAEMRENPSGPKLLYTIYLYI